MKAMQKFYALFLVSIIITSCSHTMEKFEAIELLAPHVAQRNPVSFLGTSPEELFAPREGEEISITGTTLQEMEFAFRCMPDEVVDSFADLVVPHRFKKNKFRYLFLVGSTGVGKTTLAKAIAFAARRLAGWDLELFDPASFKGEQRNDAGNALRTQLELIIQADQERGGKTIVLFDEIHQSLQNHKSKHHDTDYTARALQTFLDNIRDKNFYFIGLMNEADKIPEEFKNRIESQTIVIPKPTPTMRRLMFIRNITDDEITLDTTCDDAFIDSFLEQLDGWPGRSVNGLIDRIIKIARRDSMMGELVVIKPIHCTQALAWLTQVRDDVVKVGHQDETDEERQNRIHEETKAMHERHHQDNKRMQRKHHKESLAQQQDQAKRQILANVALSRAHKGTTQVNAIVVGATSTVFSEDALNEATRLANGQPNTNQQQASSAPISGNIQPANQANSLRQLSEDEQLKRSSITAQWTGMITGIAVGDSRSSFRRPYWWYGWCGFDARYCSRYNISR